MELVLLGIILVGADVGDPEAENLTGRSGSGGGSAITVVPESSEKTRTVAGMANFMMDVAAKRKRGNACKRKATRAATILMHQHHLPLSIDSF